MAIPPGAPTTLDDERVRAALDELGRLRQENRTGDLIAALAGKESTEIEAGTVLFRQGEPVRRIYALITGSVEEVRVRSDDSDDHTYLIRQASPGTILGIYELVGRQPHSTTARATTRSRAFVVDAAVAYRVFYNHPELRMAAAPILVIRRLRTMPLLANLDGVAISHLGDAVQERNLKAGETFYQAGDPAQTLYLIHQGQVLLEYEDGAQRWLGNGAECGFNDGPLQSAVATYDLDHNARALCPTTIYSIPLAAFYALTGMRPEVGCAALRKARGEAVAAIGVFSTLDAGERAHLLGFMSHLYVPYRHALAQQGEIADSLWILMAHEHAIVSAVGAKREALPSTHIEGPAYFNLDALFGLTEASGTLEAEAGSSWLRLHYKDYRIFLEQSGRRDVADRLAKARAEQSALVVPEQRYRWQAEGERIVHETRRHWVAALTRLMPGFLLTVFAGWLTYFAARFVWSQEDRLTQYPWVMFGLGVLWVLALLFYAWGIIDYRNDYLIVTNMRIVLQEKVVFVRESRRIAPLERVQNVVVDRLFWANLLGYANLTVQTAGNEGNIRFDRAAQVQATIDAIKAQGDERRRRFQASGRAEIQSVLEKRLGRSLALPSNVWSSPNAEGQEPTALKPPSFLARWFGSVRGTPVRTGASAGAARARASASGDYYVWHKHWLVLARNLFIPLVALLGCMALAVGVWFFGVGEGASGGIASLAVLGGMVSLFFVWYQWENWQNDIYVLDKDMLLDIERKPLALQAKENRAPLSQIVDLQLRIPSPLHYLFQFGSVKVQTAAQASDLTFHHVPYPGDVIETIRRRMDERRRAEESGEALQRAQEFTEWLDMYNRLESNGPSASPAAVS